MLMHIGWLSRLLSLSRTLSCAHACLSCSISHPYFSTSLWSTNLTMVSLSRSFLVQAYSVQSSLGAKILGAPGR